MNLQVGVKAIITNKKEGKMLLLRRSEEKYGKTDGRWDIPGGRIDPGETLLNNLRREIAEETGLSVSDDIRLLSAQDIILPEKDKHVVRLTYLIREAMVGEVRLDRAENTEYQWLFIEEAKELEDLDRYLREALDTI